jgi:hypothetical protein
LYSGLCWDGKPTPLNAGDQVFFPSPNLESRFPPFIGETEIRADLFLEQRVKHWNGFGIGVYFFAF